MKERRAFIVPSFLAVLLAFILYALMNLAQPGLTALAEQTKVGFTLGDQLAGATAGSVFWNFIYSFTDFGEGAFFTDTLGTLFMFAFALLSLYLENSKSKFAGTGVAGIGNKWYWLIGCQALGIFLANLFWRFVVGWAGWFPSFTPLVSVAPIAILCFGKPNLKKLLTGSILGAILPVYVCQMLMTYFSGPLNLPAFAAIGAGMAVSTLIGTEIFKLLPWMTKNDPTPMEETPVMAEEAPVATEETPAAPAPQKTAANLVFERVFGGDISELYFWGSNWSGLGLFLGVAIAFLLNPLAGNGGAGNVPEMMFIMIFTSAVGMVIWGPRYQKAGYAFTFESVLVMGALVGTFPSFGLILPTAVVIAIIGPAIIHWSLTTKFFQRYAACVPVQFFASVLVIACCYILRALGA